MEGTIEGIKKDVWQISDFTQKLIDDLSVQFPEEKVSVHINTVGGWFKDMEERGIHYIQRASGEKIYDSQDLELAKFIFLRRKEKFAKDIIYRLAPEHFEMRPFPPESDVMEVPKSMSDLIKSLKSELMPEINKEVEARVNQALKLQQDSMEQFQQMLPSPDQQRAERFDSIMTNQKITRKLENEAINKWNTKPEEERMVKVGLFRKAEDSNKREQFIKQYIDEHFEEALKQEFGMDEGQ